MTEFLRSWIMSILAAALLLGLLEAVMPEGPVRSVGKLAAGLILFLVVVHPLLELAPGWIASQWEQQAEQAGAYSNSLEEANESYLEGIMSQRSSEYIVAQAESLGLRVEAQVGCVWSEGLPVPSEAVVYGAVDPAGQSALTGLIQSGLGIDSEHITYEEAVP